MNDTLLNLLYYFMYFLGYIELMMKKLLNNNTIQEHNDDESNMITLINTKENISEFVFDENEDLSMDYEFGIIEKTENSVRSHFLFDELDTDEVENLFQVSIEPQFLSVELQYKDKSYSINVKDVNYYFLNNRIFSKEHIKYLIYKSYNVILDDYQMVIIDKNCDMITIENCASKNEDMYITFTNDGYKIVNNSE